MFGMTMWRGSAPDERETMSMKIRTDWNFLMGQDTGGDTPVSSDGAAQPSASPAPQPAPAGDGGASGAKEGAKDAAKEPAKETAGTKENDIAPGVGKTQPTGSGPGPDLWILLALMAGMFVLLFILPARTRKKQQKKFDEMYTSLKRNDRIMLQNGKFVTVERVEGESIFVWADDEKKVREEYHKNSVASLESEVKSRAKKA